MTILHTLRSFFSPAPAQQAGTQELPVPPTPVTRERLEAVLTAAHYKYSRDVDGDIYGVWDGNMVWFLFLGADSEFLQIRSRWHRGIGENGLALAGQAVNDWNRDRLWPKAFLRAESPEAYAAYTETTHDFSDGATGEQLTYFVETSLQTAAQFHHTIELVVHPENPEDTDQ